MRHVTAKRLRIGDSNDPPISQDLLHWLSARQEVTVLAVRQEDHALDVQYQDVGAQGSFVRLVRDRLAADILLERRRQPHLVKIVHEIRGRARFRLHGPREHDVARLATWFSQQRGVTNARPSQATRSIVVCFDPMVTSANTLADGACGVPAKEWPAPRASHQESEASGWTGTILNTVLLAGAATSAVPQAILVGGITVAALPSLRKALRALGEKRLNVDFLDTAAIAVCLGIGDLATGATMTWLLAIGDMLLERTTNRARKTISASIELDASEAWRIEGDRVERVSPTDLVVGNRIVIDVGQRVPADGVVVSGVAMVDEKALTGESLPRKRAEGERVLAATVVTEGHAVVEVERAGTNTAAAKIAQILESAGTKPMTLQRETERVADRLVLPTIILAVGSALVTSQFQRMASVLITDFGTGIRVAVPTSVLAAMAHTARNGVLVKGGQFLERLCKADTIVFDKTGTMTFGQPAVTDVTTFGARSEGEVIRFAAAAETRQTHPVAVALRQHATRLGIDIPQPEFESERYTVGVGMEAVVEGSSVLIGASRLMERAGIPLGKAKVVLSKHEQRGISTLLLAVDGELCAAIGYADAPRPECREVVASLKKHGKREIILMSGDSRTPVNALAEAVGVDRAFAELLPQDKLDNIRSLQQQGRTVVMVGDGINDAPALAAADVGISLDGGTALALETADVVLLQGGLSRLPDAFRVAEQAMDRVHLALRLVIVPNAVAIVLGALGLFPPGLAALANNGSTIVATLSGIMPFPRARRS